MFQYSKNVIFMFLVDIYLKFRDIEIPGLKQTFFSKLRFVLLSVCLRNRKILFVESTFIIFF